MSQQIVQINSKKRLQLSNGEAIRKMLILNDWTKLRIGILSACHTAANVVSTPRFAFGVCAGNQGYGSLVDAGTNLIGARTAATLTYTADIAGTFHYVVANHLPFKRVSGTFTDGTSLGNFYSASTTGGFTGRIGHFLEITKGSPNYTLQAASIQNTADINDLTDAQFVQMMEAAALEDFNSIVSFYDAATAQTLAMSEAGGDLDSIFLFWNRTTPEISIDTVAFRRVS